MPIHLDSVSRRRFIGGAAIFSLSPTISSLRGADSESQTWALLSDTHIAADPKLEARSINMADQLRRVVAEVSKEKESLAGVIVDGDCAFNDGQTGDYAQFTELLTPLSEAGLPIHFTLGNHDDRGNFFGSLSIPKGNSPVQSKHCSVIETPLADWILLDTLRYVNKVEGEIGEEQLRWLSTRLTENPEKPAIIVGHHYPQMIRTDVIPSEEKIKIAGLIDSAPFLELLADHDAAKAYIYGHSHNWQVTQEENQIHQINLPPTSYVFKKERPAGWVRATLSSTGLELELRSLDQTHSQQGEKHLLAWR